MRVGENWESETETQKGTVAAKRRKERKRATDFWCLVLCCRK